MTRATCGGGALRRDEGAASVRGRGRLGVHPVERVGDWYRFARGAPRTTAPVAP